MYGGYNLNSFKNGIKLTKEYILGRMQCNAVYGQYVLDNINPMKLTRGFLLIVNNFYNLFQLIAYVDSNLYKELYGIAKVQLAKQRNTKWNGYEIDIDSEMLENMKKYSAIDK